MVDAGLDIVGLEAKDTLELESLIVEELPAPKEELKMLLVIDPDNGSLTLFDDVELDADDETFEYMADDAEDPDKFEVIPVVVVVVDEAESRLVFGAVFTDVDIATGSLLSVADEA